MNRLQLCAETYSHCQRPSPQDLVKFKRKAIPQPAPCYSPHSWYISGATCHIITKGNPRANLIIRPCKLFHSFLDPNGTMSLVTDNLYISSPGPSYKREGSIEGEKRTNLKRNVWSLEIISYLGFFACHVM